LRVAPLIISSLDELGFSRIGQVLNLPRNSLAAQFGQEFLDYLDRAIGLVPELIVPVRSNPPPRAEITFEGPTDRWEALEAAAGEALDRLVAALSSKGQGARRLDIEVLRPDRSKTYHRVELSSASGSKRHLWMMLRPVLERIDTSRGVEGVAIVASCLKKLRPQQAELHGPDAEGALRQGEAAWGETLDVLMSRLGSESVLRYETVESHLPERAFLASVRPEKEAIPIACAITAADRPTRLFDAPIAANVMLQSPYGPILSVSWNGLRQRVVASRGPERIGIEWWRKSCGMDSDQPPDDRDYFAVQTEDGMWLWLFRNGENNRWFVHGDWE
jgi:protein ImuB